MTMQSQTEQEEFQTLLGSLYSSNTAEESLMNYKSKAWERFQEIGLPSKNTEAYRYIRLRDLYSKAFVLSTPVKVAKESIEDHIYPECKNSVIVFVNGHYQPSLSNVESLSQKIVITNLWEAIRTFGTFLNNHWAKTVKEETDPFAALNSAMHRDGIFIYLPPKVVASAPIQILHVIDSGDQPMFLMPRVQIFAGAHVELDVISTQVLLSGKGYCINQVVDFTLEENAHVRFTQSVLNENPEVWHFDSTRAILKKNSTFKTIHVTDGSKTMRHDYRVKLTGENGEALLNGIFMLEDKREAHTHIFMEHQAPQCRSFQLFKSVLNDFSRSSFEGKILVRQAAQKTEAFQLNNNLLMSDYAHADSKPNLEIFADDVKASHGATIGQLDKEQLFYMKTRGFSDTDAKNLLIYGFCKQVIDMITYPALLQEVTKRAKRYIAKKG
jgi:Fe-S cluster assembly protein SufD